MSNLTITVDAEVLKKARIRALNEGTSVSKLLRRYLEDYVSEQERRQRAVERILELSRQSKASSGGRKIARDELYDRRL